MRQKTTENAPKCGRRKRQKTSENAPKCGRRKRQKTTGNDRKRQETTENCRCDLTLLSDGMFLALRQPGPSGLQPAAAACRREAIPSGPSCDSRLRGDAGCLRADGGFPGTGDAWGPPSLNPPPAPHPPLIRNTAQASLPAGPNSHRYRLPSTSQRLPAAK